MSCTHRLSAETRAKAATELAKANLPIHDVCDEVNELLTLGIQFCPTGARPTATRIWRLIRAVESIRSRQLMTGRELECLLGHFTYIFLLSRPCLAVFRACYSYVRTHYHRRRRVWNSVLQELRVAAGLLPLIAVDFFRAWSDSVYCSDACLSGFAVHRAKWKEKWVKEVGAYSERWRFKRKNVDSARAAALSLWQLEDKKANELLPCSRDAGRGRGETILSAGERMNTGSTSSDCRGRVGLRHGQNSGSEREDSVAGPGREGNIHGVDSLEDCLEDFVYGNSLEGFPEVPPEYVCDSSWSLLQARHSDTKESVHIKEARAVVWGAKHLSRDAKAHGKRYVFLCDNMSVVLAFEKGRCSDPSLLSLCRRLAALSLACRLTFRLRWIPSEGNPSDKASRWWEESAAILAQDSSAQVPSKSRSTKSAAERSFLVDDDTRKEFFLSASRKRRSGLPAELDSQRPADLVPCKIRPCDLDSFSSGWLKFDATLGGSGSGSSETGSSINATKTEAARKSSDKCEASEISSCENPRRVGVSAGGKRADQDKRGLSAAICQVPELLQTARSRLHGRARGGDRGHITGVLRRALLERKERCELWQQADSSHWLLPHEMEAPFPQWQAHGGPAGAAGMGESSSSFCSGDYADAGGRRIGRPAGSTGSAGRGDYDHGGGGYLPSPWNNCWTAQRERDSQPSRRSYKVSHCRATTTATTTITTTTSTTTTTTATTRATTNGVYPLGSC